MNAINTTGNTKAAGIAGWFFLVDVLVTNIFRGGAPVPNDASVADILKAYSGNDMLPLTHALYS
jgi:hypothetical protein